MQQIGKTYCNPPKIFHIDQMYTEQRKGYIVIHFLCQCGVQGHRRYYKNSFKPLCRKCLREHNKKEKAERHRQSREILRKMLKVMETVQIRNEADAGWNMLLSKPPSFCSNKQPGS